MQTFRFISFAGFSLSRSKDFWAVFAAVIPVLNRGLPSAPAGAM